jgi:hypothetical protein
MSVKFPCSLYEIKKTDALKEGTVPVPPYRPALYDSAVITFSGVIALGEAQVAGVTPMNVQVLQIFPRKSDYSNIVRKWFSHSYDERRLPFSDAPAADL